MTNEEIKQAAYKLSDDILNMMIREHTGLAIGHMALMDSLYAVSHVAKIEPERLEALVLDLLAQYTKEYKRETQGFQKLED